MNLIQPNTDAAREFILLHEMAHYFAVPGFGADAGSGNPATDGNLQIQDNNLLLQNCSGLFAARIG